VPDNFDVIILGGGPAGYVCAIRASQLGLNTAVVERDKLGGVCVNLGCIPSKALLHSAYVANLVSHDAKTLGVNVGAVNLDFGAAIKHSRATAEQNSKGVGFLMKKNKITVLSGEGRLLPAKKVQVGGETYTADKGVVIATGSRVKGLPQVGLEIAGVKSAKVTKKGATLEIEKGGETKTIEVEKVLMAAGRALNVEDIGLEEVGVKLADDGCVKVDSNLQTAARGYYCIGDIAGPPMLAHKGSREGVFVAELIAGRKPHAIKYDNIPSVTYCHPEVASIGLTEDQCKQKKLDYVAGSFPLTANGRARATLETDGFVKVIRDKKYGEILGAHIVASHASELIHELVVARESEYTVEEVDLAIHAHPTLSEAVAEAALDSLGRVINA
jgi:dihydrolipoamide dehydrogenase